VSRNRFGGSDSSWFVGTSGRNFVKPSSTVTATFWSGPPADLTRVQYMDLRGLDDAATVVSSIHANSDGTIPEFFGPDDATVTRMWVSGDGGTTGVWTTTTTVEVAGSAAAAQAAAATDATTKASAAQSAAISAAASDATTKASTAQTAAISAAATDATTKANGALATATGRSIVNALIYGG